MAGPTDDERWRTALEDAARPAGAALSQQTRSGRRNRLFLVGTVVVAVTAMAAVVAALGPGAAGSGGDDVPGWQAAVGWTVSVLGLVLQSWGLVRQLRTTRAQRLWSSPLLGLTGSQRRVLLAQVRGRRPVEPVTLPLALLTARGLVVQRLLAVGNVGLAVLWIGLWVADPDSWRGLLVAGFVLLLAVSIPIAEREARRAARFVDRYGPVTSSPARQ